MVDLEQIEPDESLFQLVPRSVAIKSFVFPLSLEGETLTIAVSTDAENEVAGDLAFLTGKRIRTEPASPDSLQKAIDKHYGNGHSGQCETDRTEPDETEPTRNVVSEGSAVPFVEKMITEAIRIGASDIHVEPYERLFRVRYRLDGVLQEVERPSVGLSRSVISRLKIMADLDIAEKRRPQDGRIRVKQDGRTIDIRVSTLPTDFGEKVVLRILDKSQLRLDLSRLGFEASDLAKFQRTVNLPYGMILVTGPTGSGKTTTLYATLNHINKPGINITTIEDPIEYNLPGINQTHIRSDIGLTFAAALRSILRQDPNVIMVGEIRDSETAEIAIRAALTGHLVFSTLHTNDAPSAILRLADMGVEPFLIASSIKMILAQRLLRRICPECKQEYTPTNDQLAELGISGQKLQFYRGKGCSSCDNIGYKGRTAVYEVFSLDNGMAEIIARKGSAEELRRKLAVKGFVTLRQAALTKAMGGETTIEEVLRETAM